MKDETRKEEADDANAKILHLKFSFLQEWSAQISLAALESGRSWSSRQEA